MQVPCGKCLDCLRKYQNDWSVRMYEEFKARGFKGVFFTLTYDDAHVPKNYLCDGAVYRSTPDYGFTNQHEIDGKVVTARYNPLSHKYEPCRARKKFAEKPESVLRFALADGKRSYNEITDFNASPNKSSRRRARWLRQMQDLFVKHVALSVEPSPAHASEEPTSVSVPDFKSYEDMEIEDMVFADSDIWDIDTETGEMSYTPYEYPEDSETAQVLKYYQENTPIVSFNSVRIEDVQLWLKRNRSAAKRLGKAHDVGYFITSEYGPRTLRPHYHGVLFGVTKDDVKAWFKDWQEHFGKIVTFDNLDPIKGGLSYVSKYCSKGVFEHPLCCRDFFYFYRRQTDYKTLVCSEFHSKRYEKCIEWFGIDAPLVDPTFHMVSKSLGKHFIDHNGLRCEEFEDITRNYTSPYLLQQGSRCSSLYPTLSHEFVSKQVSADALLSGDFDINNLIIDAKRYERRFSPDSWLAKFVKRAKYTRNVRLKQPDGQYKEVAICFGLPRYYRQKMFGVNLRAAYPHFIQSENERVYKEKLESLAASLGPGKDAEVVLELERLSRQEVLDKFNRAYESQKKFLDKAKL